MIRHFLLSLFFFFSFYSSFCFSSDIPKIQLASIYHQDIEISDYFVSEKLDGVRAYWDGKRLISRNGNVFKAPEWFIKDFPNAVFDGELWIGRGKFELTSSIVRKTKELNNHNHQWQQIRFMIFDMPQSSEIFSKRLQKMQQIVKKSGSKYLQVIKQYKVKDHEALIKELDNIVKNGGEGLMLHKQGSLYKAARNNDLLKLKKYMDEEAVVISYVQGKGKYQGMLGSLLVENKEKIRFYIGSGFSDKERKNPPRIGNVITYKYFGKTKNNIPRFPVFLRIRKGF